MPSSRSLARLIVLLLILTGAAGALLLARIDLNSYREEIAATLSDALGQPVSFDRISYSLQEGLALDCRKLSIAAGSKGAFSLDAEHLYLKLEILPLLRGQLVLRQLVLDHPRLQLHLDQAPTATALQSPGRQHPMMARLREVHLHQGEISLRLPSQATDAPPIHLQKLDLRLQERPGQRLGIDLNSLVAAGSPTARLEIAGEIDAPWENADLRRNQIDLKLQLKQLPLAPLGTLFGASPLQFSGKAFFSTRLSGTLGDGVDFLATLAAEEARYKTAKSSPRPIGQWRLAGRWQQPEKDLQRLQGFSLKHGELQLHGDLALQQGNLSGRLDLPQTGLGSWLQLVPDSLLPAEIFRQAASGHLTAKLKLPPTPLAELARSGTSHLQIEADLGNLSWQLPDLPPLEHGSGQLSLTAGKLKVKKLRASWAGRPQQLEGSITLGKQLQFNLHGSATPPLEQLTAQMPERLGSGFELKGELPLRWSFRGTREQFTTQLNADLTALQGDVQGWFQKPSGLDSSLNATLNKRGQHWNLEKGLLQIGQQKLAAEGDWQQAETPSWKLHLQGNNLNLQTLLQNSRHLASHRLRGNLDLDLTLQDSHPLPLAVNGRLQLHDSGVHLTSAIADLQKINGTLLLNGKGLKTVLLNARLGASPVTLQAQLDDFSHPELKIHLQAKSLNAHELIFPSEQQRLRDVDGRLTIAARGIDFNRVEVKLDGGTDCTVKGAMQGWHQPHVALQINARYADIDEVISLWNKPQQPPPEAVSKPSQPTTPPRQGPTVAIEAQVAKGKLSRLKFEKATGLISSNGLGRLSIAPLQFQAGEGFGNGQVIVESGADHPSRLKISGHVENFSAKGIYQDLLRRESLISGTLRGDFYLEGLAGAAFLKTSHGGVSLEINDGVLNRFQFLSKVFSLLNVSQLFSLQLPDMAEEGMPFQTLDATFSLTQGLLNSEDLLVHSEAMDLSMVGDFDLTSNRIDAILGVKPLKTVDKIITKIPIAGWLLTGKEKALVTAHFTIRGNADDPDVMAVPVTSLSNKVFGIFKRVLTLPGKLITEPGDVILPQSVNPKE